MAEQRVAWTLHLNSERIQRMDQPLNRWWSGHGDLTLAGHTWSGAQYADGGMLMQIGGVKFTRSLPSRRATVALAVTTLALQRALQVDLGVIRGTIGWLYRDPFGDWQRIPRYYTGRIGQSRIVDGVFTAEVETFLGDIDRGFPEYLSHETAPPGNRYAEQARALSEGIPIRWPPF